MKTITTTLAILALAAISGTAQADDKKDRNDGNELLEMCSAVERYTEGSQRRGAVEDANFFKCLSYMDGVMDMWNWMNAAAGKDSPVCLPDEVTRGQSARIVVAYLRAHPDELHLNGSLLIGVAMMQAYPCEAKKTRAEKL